MNTEFSLIRMALTYLLSIIIGLFILIFITNIHLLYFIKIVFYRGVFLSFLSTCILAVAGLLLYKRMRIDLPTLVGAIATSLSFNLCFLVLFPVTVDRSISVFLLARIESNPNGLSEKELTQIFMKEYIINMTQIHRRIEEQNLSGNINIVNDRIYISNQGSNFLKTSRVISNLFDTDKRFVGEKK